MTSLHRVVLSNDPSDFIRQCIERLQKNRDDIEAWKTLQISISNSQCIRLSDDDPNQRYSCHYCTFQVLRLLGSSVTAGLDLNAKEYSVEMHNTFKLQQAIHNHRKNSEPDAKLDCSPMRSIVALYERALSQSHLDEVIQRFNAMEDGEEKRALAKPEKFIAGEYSEFCNPIPRYLLDTRKNPFLWYGLGRVISCGIDCSIESDDPDEKEMTSYKCSVRALDLDVDFPFGWNLLGTALSRKGIALNKDIDGNEIHLFTDETCSPPSLLPKVPVRFQTPERGIKQIECYQEAIRRCPNWNTPWQNMCLCMNMGDTVSNLIEQGDTWTVQTVMKQISRLCEMDPRGWDDIASVLRLASKHSTTWVELADGKMYDGTSALAHALEIAPDYAEGWNVIAPTATDATVTINGIKCDKKVCFQNAVKADPNYFTAWRNLSMTLHQEGKRLRVEEQLEGAIKSVSLNPYYALGWNTLGNALDVDREEPSVAVDGKTVYCVDAYIRCAESSPTLQTPWFNLARKVQRAHRLDSTKPDKVSFMDREWTVTDLYRQSVICKDDYTHGWRGLASVCRGDTVLVGGSVMTAADCQAVGPDHWTTFDQ